MLMAHTFVMRRSTGIVRAMKQKRAFALAVVLLLCVSGSLAGSDGDAVFLGDSLDAFAAKVSQGWGTLGRDTAAIPPDGRRASPILIEKTGFKKGMGNHAPGEIAIDLPHGEFTRFDANVGIQWQGGARGSVIFQVFVDDEKRFDSGVMTDSDPPKPVSVPLDGALKLRLVALDAGDGIACDMANWADARLVLAADASRIGMPVIDLGGPHIQSADVAGFSLYARENGAQIASLGRFAFAACVSGEEAASVRIPISNAGSIGRIEAEATLAIGERAEVALLLDGCEASGAILVENQKTARLQIMPSSCGLARKESLLELRTKGRGGEGLVRWRNVGYAKGESVRRMALMPKTKNEEVFPPPELPAMRGALHEALIEWDWRMQDGIGTEREPVSFAKSIGRIISRGDRLIADLAKSGIVLEIESAQWQALKDEFKGLEGQGSNDHTAWEDLWLRAHRLRRRIALANPLTRTGPLVFAKHSTPYFSHQLTQYIGSCARAGGGLFVLESPGESMACRDMTGGKLPMGSVMQPEVSYDARRILFAFCEIPYTPSEANRETCFDRRYHLYEIQPDGSNLKQITDGPYDDFAPKELPNGRILLLSTRRGGFHRCGRGPCPVHTLTLAESDGSNPRPVSYHETHEWDPSVLADGRLIYTRWDYVDRHAVHYQQLWTAMPDGSNPSIFYGNYTFNPVGVWEARQVSDSPLVMATAAAHHAMTAGSIILLDINKGRDGADPITRLTPDAPFPESETSVAPVGWHAPGSPKEYATPEEALRWPGHCYRSPYPLSEKYFLASYSFDPLIGEPTGNKANMFGLYLVDAFGNKELIYRDLNISSLWPVPLRPRPREAEVASIADEDAGREGTFFLQNVYEGYPALPKEKITRLRVVQVLPKTTPNANQPTVGLAFASPGKQVIGTVPVESDGSAYFRAPAGIPFCFQALDERGQAVQTMRSITYLQPGEKVSCIGCHERRTTTASAGNPPLALKREPSVIAPGPDGSNPLSYALLVQPVLDRNCVKCHGADKPKGPEGKPIILTGEAEGAYTRSYNVLAPRTAFSAWSDLAGNGEPMTFPDRFGARASQVMKMLLKGHNEVKLTPEDIERLVTWIDANALFYGTFDPADQSRQRNGERIAGPKLQ